jgi:hypothetical protein
LGGFQRVRFGKARKLPDYSRVTDSVDNGRAPRRGLRGWATILRSNHVARPYRLVLVEAVSVAGRVGLDRGTNSIAGSWGGDRRAR